jgi:hypothetical protein
MTNEDHGCATSGMIRIVHSVRMHSRDGNVFTRQSAPSALILCRMNRVSRLFLCLSRIAVTSSSLFMRQYLRNIFSYLDVNTTEPV